MAAVEPEDDTPKKGTGRRCAIGCESWPDDDLYKECPQCGEPTERFTNLYPISKELAASKRNHILFEEFYENDWPEMRPAKNPEMRGCEWMLELKPGDLLVPRRG